MTEDNNPQKISALPEEVRTHFLLVAPCNKKGQGRYRCVTCNHEFASTGKIRLAQHILGLDDVGSNFKNVRACPNPYLPLKQALLEQRQRHEELSSADILANLRVAAKLESLHANAANRAASAESLPFMRPAPAPLTHKKPTKNNELLKAVFKSASTDSQIDRRVSEDSGIEGEEEGELAEGRDTSEDDDSREDESDSELKKRPIVIPSDEIQDERHPAVAREGNTSTSAEGTTPAAPQIRKKRKTSPTPTTSASPVAGLGVERLLSIFQFIHQISPQALQLAVFLENMKEQQQRGIAAPASYNPMDIAKAISSLQNPLPSFPGPYYNHSSLPSLYPLADSVLSTAFPQNLDVNALLSTAQGSTKAHKSSQVVNPVRSSSVTKTATEQTENV